MTVLCIECSSQLGSVAVLHGGELIHTAEFESPRGRGSHLFAHLKSALQHAGPLDAVVVGTGPGGYNGLRVSISAAWGIARARNVRLAGVSSLLGYEVPDYFVAGDARAGQWFLAHVQQGTFLSPPQLHSPEDLRKLFQPGEPVFSTGKLVGFPEAIVRPPSAAVLARRDVLPGHPAPFYLKPPHITKPVFSPGHRIKNP
ncbi:MAG: tRNA (adenosine(37)-N6)-threonylcarbamoyltransferase complex dimerization subunit type 1 TsaB [Chthoniobacterales bacterium]|nr:tRNA (adenosine(37)-N6)-threonylcarbamoyltransferase complex dimerization subunit type 1 TsaB [Chthoniobacterales bacterium]